MARLIARILLAALFLLAGAIHLLNPHLFMPIMPPWVPAPLAAIVISGVCELLGGLGLLIPRVEVQRTAAWGLLLLLVAVFPANVYMAVGHVQIHGFPTSNWMSWARLPLQPLIMLIVSWSAGLWPKAYPAAAATGNAGSP